MITISAPADTSKKEWISGMKWVFFGMVVFFSFVVANWGQGADDHTIEHVEFNYDARFAGLHQPSVIC